MQLIIYPFIVCVGIFLIQLFFIIRKNKIVYNDIQKKDKKHWKLVIKIYRFRLFAIQKNNIINP